MATWTPPTIEDVSRVLPETRDVPFRLMRHYSELVRGRNVYITTTGVVTEVDPGPTATRLTLYGGHVPVTISSVDATLLTAAGYGANIS